MQQGGVQSRPFSLPTIIFFYTLCCVIRPQASDSDDSGLNMLLHSLSPFSAQCTSYRPPKPKKACGVCSKVRRHVRVLALSLAGKNSSNQVAQCPKIAIFHAFVYSGQVGMRLMFVYICFSDVYLCAVLICLVGLLCMCMFTVTVTCQYIQRRQRLKGMQHHKDNTHLILTTVLFLYHSSCFLLKLDTSCISLSFCYCVSNRVVSVQIITFWSKALTTGKCLRVTKPHTQS